MSELRFSVKEKSINQFFIDNVIDYNPNNNRNPMEINCYYLMRDEIYVKRASFSVGQIVTFELFDEGYKSKKELVNHYEYNVVDYDDISFKLELINFSITLK